MPLYKTDRVEYNIVTGNITIAMENGQQLPAYWAHPARGNRFPAVALIHNWWGITAVVRRMANLFAQTGYYAIIPDLFDGQLPKTPTEAAAAVKSLGDNAFRKIDASLTVLESHHMSNRKVAAVGIGMGGTLAYQAAIERDDLEVAVSFYGFPQKMLGTFDRANTPILAVYGTEDQFIKPVVVRSLKQELATTPLANDHQVLEIQGAKHDFIVDRPNATEEQQVNVAWQTAQGFIDKFIEPPAKPQRKTY
ncbi:MAG: dienelactone hydrolase family protein [Chloroflexota bacterium]